MRLATLVAVLASAVVPHACPSPALAQGFGDSGGMQSATPAARRPNLGPRRQATSGLSEFASEELVAAIQVRGNETVRASRITEQMQTRVGRPFDSRTLGADIRKLASLPYFVTVQPRTRSTPEGRVVILDVVERKTLRYVEYLGNRQIADRKLKEATGLEVGGAIDPYAVEEGRRKIEALYREGGHNRVHVSIEEGARPNDRGVVYSINEGNPEKVWAVEFVGNEFASDGQLKTKIKSKPNFTRIFGGKLNREELDTDVTRLVSYYRSFGFFRAKVGREVEFGDSGKWATIRFVITEGPRYRVRNVAFNGVERFEVDSLRGGLELKPGMEFEKNTAALDVQYLTDAYGARGYIFADIQAETIFLEEPGQIDLVYNVEEGERWRVGQVIVNIDGENAHTKTTTALNRLSIRPGDYFDTRKIRDSKRRLGAAGVFNTNPAQGPVPDISFSVSDETRERLAREAEEKERARGGVFRGQSPESRRSYSVRKPPVDTIADSTASSIYRVEQSVGTTPGDALWRSGTPYATPPATDNNVYGDRASLDPLQRSNPYAGADPRYGVTPAPAAGSSPVGYGGSSAVQPLAPADPPTPVAAPGGVTPTQYTPPPTPAYGQSGAYRQPAAAPPGLPPITGTPPGGATFNGPGAGGVAPPTFGAAPPAYPPPGGVAAPGGPAPWGAAPPVGPAQVAQFPTGVSAPTPVPPPNDPFADININLGETQTGRFMVGVAVNSDAGVVGQIMLDERNFDWRRLPRSWRDVYDGTAFRGGGQRFRLEAAPGTEVQRYLASWSQPYLYDTPISLNLSGSYFDRRFDDWDEQRLGGRIGLGYQWLDRDLTGSLTYRGENVNIHDPRDPNLPEYAEVLGDNSLHGFGLRLVTDKRDNPFLATEGYFLSAVVEQVVGSFTYTRAELDARTYYLLRERPDHTGRHVMNYQTRIGITGSDTPVYDRFYAGGFSTMRGYDFRGASPVKGPSLAEVGGDFRWLNTLEYMFPLSADDMINGVAFVDFGTVNENVSLGDFRVAPGVGLRIQVPAMGPAPIALDFAFPVAGPETDEEQVFTFNVGFQR